MTSGHASLLTSLSRGHAHTWLSWQLGIVIFLFLQSCHSAQAASGCADGSREGLHGFESVAACSGVWHGHVDNATLCASGWRVCTSFDVTLLRNITWSHARDVSGCMAVNAAQDGGRCRECRGDLEHDDMAGVGRDCAHQSVGMTSCISGGRMDASCCVDAHFHNACHFKPGLITGVVCCRLPVKRPHIVIKPPGQLTVYLYRIFLLTCQASGMPPPRRIWYKDGRRLQEDGNSRIMVLSSGDLLVTMAERVDSGLYTCEVINNEGIDMASSYVTVAEYTSGCADGITDGLHLHRGIHACAGTWQGHVKKGRSLCARGWKVCTPRHGRSLRQVTSFEMFDLAGCYAYNAANKNSRCRRCKNVNMAGMGRDCGHVSYAHTSCLAHGRIDVFPTNVTSSCDFTSGVTSGVICCKKSKRRKSLTCSPRCENRATCIAHNRCRCRTGYKGARCQIPICPTGCGPKGQCVGPSKCRCQPGYLGPRCRRKARPCPVKCRHGGRCRRGRCRCGRGFWGKACQIPVQHALLTRLNRTEK